MADTRTVVQYLLVLTRGTPPLHTDVVSVLASFHHDIQWLMFVCLKINNVRVCPRAFPQVRCVSKCESAVNSRFRWLTMQR